jgi:hypothetical protein
MNYEFNVEILTFVKISEIENAWLADDYKALLSMMDRALVWRVRRRYEF